MGSHRDGYLEELAKLFDVLNCGCGLKDDAIADGAKVGSLVFKKSSITFAGFRPVKMADPVVINRPSVGHASYPTEGATAV